jgi:hypothetical protein
LSQIRVVESLNLDNTYIHGIFHKEIPCVTIFTSNKQECQVFFHFSLSKPEDRRVKQVLQRGALYHWEGKSVGERV